MIHNAYPFWSHTRFLCGLLLFLFLFLLVTGFFSLSCDKKVQESAIKLEITELLGEQYLERAREKLLMEPQTVTMFRSERSAGGKHDFHSEGDYWWPDPENPGGPYINRDGVTNPDLFYDHRNALMRFSRIVGRMATAYLLTGDETFADHALRHLNAWFVDPETRMNPSLKYSQAIPGRYTGRGVGVIDSIHLMEVAQSVRIMKEASGFDPATLAAIRSWFAEYLTWLTTHQYSLDEMNAHSNHATTWVMQVASFALLTGDEDLLEFCRLRYMEVLLPMQMDSMGAFPHELSRTRPYSYSLFNLDAMVMVVHILSDETHDLWHYETPDGRSIRTGIEFLHPYVQDKNSWPHPPDVIYWEDWPVAHPFLLFGAVAFDERTWFQIWTVQEHFPQTREVIRNLPVRNPLIWF